MTIYYVTTPTKALEALEKCKRGDIIHMDENGEDKIEEGVTFGRTKQTPK